MAIQKQSRRGTTTQHASFTGADGEVTVDTTKKTLVVHDGATAGGIAQVPASMTLVQAMVIVSVIPLKLLETVA